MADNLKYNNKRIEPTGIIKDIDDIVASEGAKRKSFERRWYDNNFFDDGYHFRYVSRSTGKILDQSESSRLGVPDRSIPKASRQLRGVANLLLQPEYRPTAYPDEMEADRTKAINDAKAVGIWLTDAWEDDLNLKMELIDLVIKTGKHSISYLKVMPDYDKQKVKVYKRDAFDLYLDGSKSNLEDCPYIVEVVPRLISDIKADPNFDKEKTKNITPDNKYASSEIKEAYLKARYGTGTESDFAATLLQKEAWIKTHVTEDNAKDILESGKNIENVGVGDTVMRHTITAGGLKLLDEYIDMQTYPYIDLRLEPGPLYQVPLIERFIPANKSLDIVMSRIERYTNTMTTGTWLQREGENFQITNIPGGQKITYKTQPPVQGQMAPLPSHVFNFIELLNSVIEEQGASTTALNQLPDGVKSGKAIEMVKATEYANLKIPGDMLKDTVKRIANKMIEYASDFVIPITVSQMKPNGETETFKLVGERRINEGVELPNGEEIVVIKKGTKVDIEVESGLGFTAEGKKETMQQIVDYMGVLAQQGLITQEAVQVVTEKFLDIFQFGSTQEFMESMKTGNKPEALNDKQLQQMKIAILETLQDAGVVGQEADNKMVDSTKVGMVEAMQDLQQ